VNGSGSGSCPIMGFGISGVKIYGSCTRKLINKIDFRDTSCENVRCMERFQDHVQRRVSISSVGLRFPRT
jgi:hypothetical protein